MILPRDIEMIERLTKLGAKSKILKKHTVISALGRKRQILITGINDYVKTHPLTPQIKKNATITVHSEINCIAKLFSSRMSPVGLTLYVVSLTKAKKDLVYAISSKPCPSCMKMIRTTDLTRIVYSKRNGNSFSVEELLL